MNSTESPTGVIEKAKGLAYSLLGVGFLVLLIGIVLALVHGMVWIAAWLYPIVQILAGLGFAALVLCLIPSSIFKGSRHFCGNGIVLVSYVWGISVWMYSTLVLYQLWGPVGMVLGFILLGFGSVPLACVALLFRWEWGLIGQLVLWTVIVYVIRALGYWIRSKGESSELKEVIEQNNTKNHRDIAPSGGRGSLPGCEPT